MSWKTMLYVAGAAVALMARADEIALDADDWVFTRDTSGVTTYRGQPALSLYNATAWLKDGAFRNGTIAFKVAFPKERGFVGVKFRAADQQTYEHFYLRPHQSGNPDANQYTPVINGNSGWQIYYGPRYSAPVVYPYGEWIDVKLVLSGDAADVYINSVEPVLHIANLLLDGEGSGFGFDSFLTQAFITDVRLEAEPQVALVGEPMGLPELPEHLVRVWDVAGPVETLSGPLPRLAGGDLEWRELAVDENGVANLGRAGARREDRFTMLARLVVDAEQSVTRPMRFGFSDTAVVFVNGTPVYRGDNTYRSRDYRYLGTVGRFDTLLLPLAAGRNEIIFAVEEAFGGWAVTAAFDDVDGIRIH